MRINMTAFYVVIFFLFGGSRTLPISNDYPDMRTIVATSSEKGIVRELTLM